MSPSSSPPSSKLSARELFDKYDVDKSGTISFTEFQTMLPDLGINLSIPKQIEYFRLCDKDGSGQIDYEEFKVALFVCDTEEINHAGFNAGTILRPKDAFEMFDKDGSRSIDEEEFHFLLKYLNIEIDEGTHEKFFRKCDLDKSGYIEYPEFKRAWLRLANTRKELESRGIDIPTLATKYQMIHMLDKALEEEEKQEKLALEEAKRWRLKQDRLKQKREYILKARHQAKVELCSALDAGGSVYVFGSGTLDQFANVPRLNMNTSFFDHEGYELLLSLWKSRVGAVNNSNSYPKTNSSGKVMSLEDDLKLNMDYDDDETCHKGLIYLDRALNIQQNTVWLWGHQCKGIAISDSVMVAYCENGSLYSWGGIDQWWHQLEADSCWHTKTRGEMTVRSNELLGCPANWRRDLSSGQDSALGIQSNKYKSECDKLAEKIQTVLQYYNAWSIPDGKVNRLDHAKKCLRNNIDRQRVVYSLQLRGKTTEDLAKIEMVKILYEDIMLEYKLLGEPTHLELRGLEKEMVELKQQQKLKLAKRRQFRFAEKWRPLREAQRLDGKSFSREKNTLDKEQNSSVESHRKLLVKRLKDKNETIIKGGKKNEITMNGITPRGPQPSTNSSKLSWKMIDAGANHIGIIDNKDRLLMWGLNTTGQLGSRLSKNEKEKQNSLRKFNPRSIDLPNIRQFSCGHSHTAATDKSGKIFVWGSASCGKLGLGDVTSDHECYSSVPVQLKCLSSKKITVVSCGSSHTACVESKGGLYIWGNGGGGRLGLGHKRDVFSPTLVKTIQECIVDVSCGNCQTLAITAIDRTTELCNRTKVRRVSGGRLYVAGPTEILGSDFPIFEKYSHFSHDGNKINPIPIHQVSAGFSHQSAISLDGELFIWGDNSKGCCGQDCTKVHFVPIPTKVGLYNKPEDLAEGKETHRSIPYGNQPFFEVDLGQIASIREIKLWSCLKVPNNPAVKKDTFTGRLFPCWIMIAYESYPDAIGEGQLDNALKLSITKKRFEENQHESIWKQPRGTKGRYIRVQMEGLNLMDFDKLQVFGSYNSDSLDMVASSTCGKRVTAVIVSSTDNVDDITASYRRAIAADPYNAKILQQLNLYKGIRDQLQEEDISLSSKKSVGCILCNGVTLCSFCQMKNEFHHLLTSHESNNQRDNDGKFIPRTSRYLEQIIKTVLETE